MSQKGIWNLMKKSAMAIWFDAIDRVSRVYLPASSAGLPDGGDVHWRSISKDNILTVYGRDDKSRIFDPGIRAGYLAG